MSLSKKRNKIQKNKKMKTLLYILDISGGIFSRIFRIITKGKTRPTWNMAMELTQMSMRKTLSRSLGEEGTVWFRKIQSQSSKAFKKSPNIAYKTISIGDFTGTWLKPKNASSDKTVIYFHGGGYVYSSTETHLAFLNDLALAMKTNLLSVDYRLAPEHLFPTAHKDAFMAYQHLIKDISPEKVIIMGDSAGAGLCTGILLQCKENGISMPHSAVLISPWVNPYADDGSMDENGSVDIGDKYFLLDCADKYLKGKNKRDKLVAPIFVDLTGLPPMLIQIGTAEMLLDQSKALAEKAKTDGLTVQYTEYEDMYHTFLIASRSIKKSQEAMAEIVEFVNR